MMITRIAIGFTILLLGPGTAVSFAEQTADTDRVQTESTGKDSSTLPAAVIEPTKPEDVKPAAAGKPASPRRFFDVFYGSARTADDDVTGSSQPDCFLFCPPPTVYNQEAHFRSSPVYGVRIGKWLEEYPAIGIAGDISYLRAEAPNVSIWYAPISFVVLGRYQLFPADSVPEGRLQLYGGAMLSLVVGNIEVNGVRGSSTSLGYGILFGAAWHFPSFALFGEYRLQQANVSFSDDPGFFGAAQSASADLDSKQIVYGVSFKY